MNATELTAIGETLADCQRRLDALGSPGNVPMTHNAQEQFARDQSFLVGRMASIRASVATLREVEPQIADDEKWLAQLASGVQRSSSNGTRFRSTTWRTRTIDCPST